jgi:hypothetical protein
MGRADATPKLEVMQRGKRSAVCTERCKHGSEGGDAVSRNGTSIPTLPGIFIPEQKAERLHVPAFGSGVSLPEPAEVL